VELLGLYSVRLLTPEQDFGRKQRCRPAALRPLLRMLHGRIRHRHGFKRVRGDGRNAVVKGSGSSEVELRGYIQV
jgi:hypothetical protein